MATDEQDRVLCPKLAFFAAAHLITLIDRTVKPAPSAGTAPDEAGLEVARFARKDNHECLVLLWDGSKRPSDSLQRRPVSLVLTGARFTDPVYVDLISGAVHELPRGGWHMDAAGNFMVRDLPVWDAPVALVERAAIDWSEKPD